MKNMIALPPPETISVNDSIRPIVDNISNAVSVYSTGIHQNTVGTVANNCRGDGGILNELFTRFK